MLVMGILNVTPDSFADGGLHLDPAVAISRGLEMIQEGADIIDIGGESTRPGAERVSAEDEQSRVLPVIQGLVGKGAILSIDTMRASTAILAVGSGATNVNEVIGGAAGLGGVLIKFTFGWVLFDLYFVGDLTRMKTQKSFCRG